MSKKLPSDELVSKRPLFDYFEKLSDIVDSIIGTPYWFGLSLLLILVWLPSGFFIGFGEIWHLIINTTTTILTFIMMSLLHASESKWEKRIDEIEEIQKNTLLHIKRETDKMVQSDKNRTLAELHTLPALEKETVHSIN
jgi:low affinity Fe/Cu permease